MSGSREWEKERREEKRGISVKNRVEIRKTRRQMIREGRETRQRRKEQIKSGGERVSQRKGMG